MVQMSQKEQDIQMMLAAGCHLGTKNVNFQMERYGKIYSMRFIKIKERFVLVFFLPLLGFFRAILRKKMMMIITARREGGKRV